MFPALGRSGLSLLVACASLQGIAGGAPSPVASEPIAAPATPGNPGSPAPRGLSPIVSTLDATGQLPVPRASAAPAGNLLVVPIDLPSALRLAGQQNASLVIAYQRTLAATAAIQLAAAQALPNLNGGSNFDGHSGVLQQS